MKCPFQIPPWWGDVWRKGVIHPRGLCAPGTRLPEIGHCSEEQKPWPGQMYMKRGQERSVLPVMAGSKLLLQNILGCLGKLIYNLAWSSVVLLIYCKPSLEIWKGCFWKWFFLSPMVDRNLRLGEGQHWRHHNIFVLKPEQRNYTSLV